MNALAVFIGGGVGSLARYGVGWVATRLFNGPFPWGTLIANLLATVILVVITLNITPHLAQLNRQQQAWVLLGTTGFCGGFSTFSTFSLETLQLFAQGEVVAACANVALNVAGCIVVGALVWRAVGH